MELKENKIADSATSIELRQYKLELLQELESILSYWTRYVVDEINGGFWGSVNNENKPDPKAPKGLVMNARICWAFSAAYNLNPNSAYLVIAKRAHDYLLEKFNDPEHGGMYWSLDFEGEILKGKKQIYGQAFCIYGLTEYHRATGNETSLSTALQLYELIETHSRDKLRGGYIEAFERDWTEVADLRLSDKDDNERKTMNTHLHIIEAYANLYKVWPNPLLEERIRELLSLFDNHFYNQQNHHFNLFFNDDWQSRSILQSFGHDIEAAWLLQQCAEVISDASGIARWKTLSVDIAHTAILGLDKDGGLWYEFEPTDKRLVKEKHSWPQAEAMIGFFNAFQVSGQIEFLNHSLRSWEFVKAKLRDESTGEWFWGIKSDGSIMDKDKAGFWKCPYHNSRACIELVERINALAK